MKRFLLFLLFSLFISNSGFAQNTGITYQAVIYNPSELPGADNPYAPLNNQNICIQFSIVDADGNTEYQEEVQATTDAFGMVNLLIGTNTQTDGYAVDFANIEWSEATKFLVVELDVNGNCMSFLEISNQPLTYVPLAMYAVNKDNTQAIADNAEKISLLQNPILQSGYLYVGNSSNVATETPSTGTGDVVRAIDATLTGTTTLNDLDVTTNIDAATIVTSGNTSIGGDLAVSGNISGNFIIEDVTGNAATSTQIDGIANADIVQLDLTQTLTNNIIMRINNCNYLLFWI